MTDPVSLALGIAPIFIAGVQGLLVLTQKIDLLRHHRREVDWLRTKVEVQAHCFKGEIHHVVIDALDARTAQTLIRDDDNALWKSAILNDTLAKHLGELSPEFIKAVQGVQLVSEQIETKLAIFAPVDVKSPLFRAVRDKFRIAFRKQEYSEDIRALKEWIAELKRLRKLAAANSKRFSEAKTDQPHKERSELTAGRSAGPDITTVRQYKAIRRLSFDLQALLQQQWSCCDRSHLSHSGRLFLCRNSRQNCIVWLLEHAGQRGYASLTDRLLFYVSSQQLDPVVLKESLDQKPTSGNIESLCCQLNACSVTSVSGTHPRHLSYIDIHRQRFMFEPKPTDAQNFGGWDPREITSLIELLNHPVCEVILDHERLLLALALVRGTLMNYSTLGWPHGGIMEGISFYSKINTDINVTTMLDSLHIAIQIGKSVASNTDKEGGSVTAAVSEDELQYTFGIRNPILYRLGVALLSIGLWSKVNWEDVEAVRRKAAALDSLGRRFNLAVRRLIYSDFGVDTVDLSNERLQVEILRTVIVPLEKLAELHREAEPERWPGQTTPNW